MEDNEKSIGYVQVAGSDDEYCKEYYGIDSVTGYIAHIVKDEGEDINSYDRLFLVAKNLETFEEIQKLVAKCAKE